ncbi:unnamed protein product, partial [Candidula unifasciata]
MYNFTSNLEFISNNNGSLINPKNMKPLHINVAFLISVSNFGSGIFYGAAFFLAIDELQRIAANDGIPVTFNWTFRDVANKEPNAINEMAKLHCKQKVSAFIGPDVYCKPAGLLATAFHIPYMTYNCDENHHDIGQHLMVNAETSFGYVSRFIYAVLHHYKWRSFWLVSGNTIKWQNVANLYVFLGVYESLLLFLREMKELGMTDTGDYAVVAVDDSNDIQSGEKTYLKKQERLSAVKNVLIIRPEMPDINRPEFEDTVYSRSLLPPINLKGIPKGVFKRPDIPTQAYHLYDATMFYGRAVMALMAIPGADPENATHIIYYLRCNYHDSNGQPPISDPVCGFDGKLCPSSKLAEWKIAIIIASVLIFVLIIVVILILGIRHYMYEQKLERLAWKIEREEIQILNPGQFRELNTPSRPRLTRKNLELTRALKKQLQLRKELSHENINRFIGACIEVPHLYMVTQYCPRKSLQDILRNENSPLDDMFITSLVQDLIRGMHFIHESEIGYHGNLKSSNCLVDSRWTVKITDFGLSAIGPPPLTTAEDEEYFR